MIVQPGVPVWQDRIFDIPQNPMGQPGAVVLRNLTIQGGNTPSSDTGGGNPCFLSGGGVRNWSGGNLTLDNVTIQNNAIQLNGGGVCSQGSALTVQGSRILSNTASSNQGCGIAATGPSLVVQNTEIRNNTAFRAGGGIAESTNTFTLQSSQVLSNAVTALGSIGGGIASSGGTSPKTILTSTVAYNRAEGDGGGIHNQTVRGLQVNNSTVLSNTAGASLQTPGNGGGIWSGSPLQLNNTAVLSNAALITGPVSFPPGGGGGIYHQGAPLGINGGQVSHNQAVVFVDGGSIAGGGIWNNGTATLNNVAVTHNRADADSAVSFAQIYGGGIQNGAAMNLTNSWVDFNNAVGDQVSGGGINNRDFSSSGSPQLTLQSSSVSTNTAQAGMGFAQGGGIANSSGVVDALNSQVRNNVASGAGAQGGGIDSFGVLTLTSSLVVSNTANASMGGSSGGGVLSSGAAALITDTQILSNTSTSGGGGWYNTVSDAQMWNSQVRFNQAQGSMLADGGGMLNSASGTQIRGSAVCSNQASQDGGGIANFADLNLVETVICDNVAGQSGSGKGGGVFNGGSSVFILLSEVLTNTASDDGGGVFNAGGSANIIRSTVRANQATSGGGAQNDSGTMQITQSTFESNTASNTGGGALNNASMFIMMQSAFLSNTALAGGGVLNTSIGTLQVGGSTLQGNSATSGSGGVWNQGSASIQSSALVNNSASTSGGGVHHDGGTLESENNTLSGNSANQGGGLYAGPSSSAYLTHTTIASNTNGSGIFRNSGSVAVQATLLAYNSGNNCNVSITDNGNSLSSDATCGVSTLSTNPLLQPLALNGGQTLNHALSPGSPALDVVPAPCAVSSDQRGVSRPQGFACDIGAFELEEANLAVSKSANPSPVNAGETITYTVIVTNLSSSGAANSIVLTDTLSGGATFGGVVSSGGFALQSSTSTQAIFTLSTLPAGASVTLVFTATAPGNGPITNNVVVSSGNPDPNPSNNTASVTTGVVPVAYLSVTKSQDYVPYATGIILPGGTVTYTVVVTNNGPSNVPILVQDTLASGVTFVAASISVGTCSFSAPTVSCNTSVPIPAGSAVTAIITVTAPAASNTTFTNTAQAQAPALPSTPFASNVVTLTTAANAELRAFKSGTPSPVFAGQTVTYTVVVENFGPDPASNVVITDVFQGGATFGSVVATGGGATLQSSSASGVTFTAPSLGVGSAAIMTYTVIAPTSGVITNTVTATSDAIDPNPANNVFTVTTPVTPVANLQISKAQSVVSSITGTVAPGGTITYTLLVTNTGPSSASFVTVTDNLPAGVTYVSASGSGWSCSFSAPTVTCTAGTLSVGAAPAIQIVATAPITGGLTLTNTASVTAATHPSTPVNSNSVTVKVQYRVFAPIVRKP